MRTCTQADTPRPVKGTPDCPKLFPLHYWKRALDKAGRSQGQPFANPNGNQIKLAAFYGMCLQGPMILCHGSTNLNK